MPFRQFIKRRKLDEGEDDWCDALNDLHLDSSSSSDEYFDALEEQTTKGPERATGTKRKRAKSHKRSQAQSKSGIFSFKPPSIFKNPVTKIRDRFQFGSAVSSSSSADDEMEMESGYHSLEADQQQNMMTTNTGTLTDDKLWEVVVCIGNNGPKIRRLGLKLGLNDARTNAYCPYGKPVEPTRTLRMLQYWQHETSAEQQMPGLLEALRSANLDKAAHIFHQEKVVDHPTDSKVRSTESSTNMEKVPRQKALLKSDIDKGISDDQLKELANYLLGDNYRSARSLGQKLGISNFDINRFLWSRKPNDSSGILSMLRAWRKKTHDSKQKTDLLAAVEKANLQHLAAHLHQPEDQRGKTAPIPQGRRVTVTLMTSSQMHTIDGLKKKLETLKKSQPDLIDAVKILQLPYSRIQYYEFAEDVDIMILCHSIENRRFAITNVTDSLYDEFLDYCYKTLGKDKIVVIAHDFPPEAKEVRDVKMDSFKHTQWTTFEKAGLVMICGMMDRKPEMQEEDWDSLVRFLEAASKSTPVKEYIKNDPRLQLHGQKDSRECNPESKSNASSVLNRFRSQKPVSRKPIIYLCTSFGLDSVRGIQENLRNLLEKFHHRFEITAQELPYNYRELREFRFPAAEVGVHDAMILCHSMRNRGFLITDVENSIYDQYLHHCNKVFGEEHVAVIVHDFDCSEEILGNYMDAFQRTQPKTFQLAGFVALARNATNVQLSRKDSTKLEEFVMKIR